ncbi:MAG TPA: lipopolysaccharide biosynthesis protein, partial [Cellvibrio sp.]
GGAVILGSQGVNTIIQLTSTIVLARLLSPDDYGVIAMVMAVTGFARLFRDLGLSAAAVQKKELSRDLQTNLFWINVAMGALLTLTVAAAAPFVGMFYKKPELVPVTAVLSLSFTISSLGTQHGAGLVRGMKFGRKESAGIVGTMVALVVAMILAFRGFSYWALVWSSLAGNFATTVLLFVFSNFRPGLPSRRSGVRELLRFGVNITAFEFVNYFHRNLDNIVIGRFCGPASLGLYSRAYSLLMLPINSIRGPINSVGFPALSKLQNNPVEFRNYFRKATCFLALVSMPLTTFLAIASEPLIRLLLGEKWNGIAPIFSVLAVVAFIQPTVTLWGMVVLSRGMGKRYLQIGIFNTVCSAIGFLAGLPWGAMGVAVGYAISTYVTTYPILVWAFHGTPLRFRDFSEVIARPFIASIVAAIICYFTILTLNEIQNIFWVATVGFIYSILYLGVIRMLPGGQSDFHYLIGLARHFTQRFRLPALLKSAN